LEPRDSKKVHERRRMCEERTMRARRVTTTLCSVALVTAATMPARAQQDGEPEEVHVRGTQASGFEQRARVEDAPREVTDAASLVEPLLGVHVRRLGADDGFATMSIRGSSSNDVAFYLAGVPLPAASDPTVDLSTLPLWPGTQARVFRTFAPGTLGPGSLGGTLSIDPPSASATPRTDVWTAGGSFGALRMRVGDVSDLGGGVRVASGLSANRSDGDFSFYNVAHNPPMSDPRELIPRLNADFAQASGLVSVLVPLHAGPSRSGTLRTTVLLQGREQGLPGTIFLSTPAQRLGTDRELATTELALPLARGTWTAQLWGVRQGSDFRDGQPTGLGPSAQTLTVATAGASTGWRRRIDTVQLAAKLDAHAERFEPGLYVGPTPPSGALRMAAGASTDLEWRPARAIVLAASARADAFDDTSNDAAIAPSTFVLPTAHLGGEAAVGPFTFALHGGYTSRPANFIERFGTPGGYLPTPDLRPESALAVDGGARFRRRFGKLSLEAEIDGFAQSATDLITFVPVSARALPKATNIGRATIAGVEAEVRARFAGLDLRASYTGLHTQNDQLCTPVWGCPPLPGRPAHDLVVDVSYRLGPLQVRYGVDGIIGATIDDPGTIEVPARVLQSIGARLDVPGVRGVRVALDVRNLFDVRTASYPQSFLGTSVPYPIGDVYYYPLPGRSLLVSLSWEPRLLR